MIFIKNISEYSGIGPEKYKKFKSLGIKTNMDLLMCIPDTTLYFPLMNQKCLNNFLQDNICEFDILPYDKVVSIENVNLSLNVQDIKKSFVSKVGKAQKKKYYLVQGNLPQHGNVSYIVDMTYFHINSLRSVTHTHGLVRGNARILVVKKKQTEFCNTYSHNPTHICHSTNYTIHVKIAFVHPTFFATHHANTWSEFVHQYPLTTGLHQSDFRKVLQQINIPKVNEWIPYPIMEKYNLKSWNECIYDLHHSKLPQESRQNRIARLACDEIIYHNLMQKKTKRKNGYDLNSSNNIKSQIQKAFLSHYEFELTSDQEKCLNEIQQDLISEHVMFRILNGDVGSGKTIIAFLSAVFILCKNLNILSNETSSKKFSNVTIQNSIQKSTQKIIQGSLYDLQSQEHEELYNNRYDEQHNEQNLELQQTQEIHQVAFISPTEVLANQHYNNFIQAISNPKFKFAIEKSCSSHTNYNIMDNTDNNVNDSKTDTHKTYKSENNKKNTFKMHRIEAKCITGSTKPQEKRKIKEELENGKISIIFGTHALFEENVKFANLKYVIIDEQHKFGVKQRIAITSKGNEVDLLIMSATPIPRTLEHIINGYLSVSRMESKIPGRVNTETYIIYENKIDELTQKILNKMQKGAKGYWVCPAIDLNDDMGSVNNRYEKIMQHIQKNTQDSNADNNNENNADNNKNSHPQDDNTLNSSQPSKIAILHGAMKTEEKNQILQKFRNGEIQLLISTTVIEIGINVPTSTFIVIENAERFGLAQLHQLRGRVGRGSEKSYCFLICCIPGRKILERLRTISSSVDGFFIAEKDLETRGGGEFYGLNQSGNFSIFNFVDYQKHKEMILDISSNMQNVNKESIMSFMNRIKTNQ